MERAKIELTDEMLEELSKRFTFPVDHSMIFTFMVSNMDFEDCDHLIGMINNLFKDLKTDSVWSVNDIESYRMLLLQTLTHMAVIGKLSRKHEELVEAIYPGGVKTFFETVDKLREFRQEVDTLVKNTKEEQERSIKFEINGKGEC